MDKSKLAGIVVVLVMLIATVLVVTNGSGYSSAIVVGQQNIESVLCIGEYGDADTYHINMPLFEGFSGADTRVLRGQYIEGFCNSL